MTGPYILAGYGLIDPAAFDADAQAIAARIISGDSPDQWLRGVVNETGSVEYGAAVATRAAELVVKISLDPEEIVISIVPVVTGRLATFLHRARSVLALAAPQPEEN